MGQGTETCTDRPTEVSVIRFVSRNRTIEEIAPKKEIYMCKQRGCGKKFTNQDEFKTHETLESLKIRFICREPDCGEELSDPGSMWRHYQEWHNNETNVFICPYTSCNSIHTTSENLEEHIETSHRQLPTLPMEPEVICFEGPENAITDAIERTNENEYFNNDVKDNKSLNFLTKDVTLTECASKDNSKKNQDLPEKSYFPKNENLLITKEKFLIKYESISKNNDVEMEHKHENNLLFINSDVSVSKNSKNDNFKKQKDDDNFDKAFQIETFDIVEDHLNEVSNNCSEDEEYTPKKQRMSRYKQESYKCDVAGCGKMYKYISHYRHHQDSHKFSSNAISAKMQKPKQKKANTVSFFLCKMPGCGAQVDDVTGLWKHYQDNHANSKLPNDQEVKNSETFRCTVSGCEAEFNTNFLLYKHFNEHHTHNFMSNINANTKTGNGSSIHFVSNMFHDDAASQKLNFKTDFNAKRSDNISELSNNKKDKSLSLIVKEELRD